MYTYQSGEIALQVIVLGIILGPFLIWPALVVEFLIFVVPRLIGRYVKKKKISIINLKSFLMEVIIFHLGGLIITGILLEILCIKVSFDDVIFKHADYQLRLALVAIVTFPILLNILEATRRKFSRISLRFLITILSIFSSVVVARFCYVALSV